MNEFGMQDDLPKPEPASTGFMFGYCVCELIFFGMPGMETPSGFEPHTTGNPFAEGTEEQRGFSEAYYDFTQK